MSFRRVQNAKDKWAGYCDKQRALVVATGLPGELFRKDDPLQEFLRVGVFQTAAKKYSHSELLSETKSRFCLPGICIQLQHILSRFRSYAVPIFAGILPEFEAFTQGGLRLNRGQGEIEGSAFVGFGLSPDSAAMTLDDAADNGEANTCPFKSFLIMEALEDAKYFAGMAHVETDAVIANEVDVFTILFAGANFDRGLFLQPGEFKSIRNEVGEHMAQEERIPVRGREWMHFDAGAAGSFVLEQIGENVLNEGGEVDSLQVDGLASKA